MSEIRPEMGEQLGGATEAFHCEKPRDRDEDKWREPASSERKGGSEMVVG